MSAGAPPRCHLLFRSPRRRSHQTLPGPAPDQSVGQRIRWSSDGHVTYATHFLPRRIIFTLRYAWDGFQASIGQKAQKLPGEHSGSHCESIPLMALGTTASALHSRFSSFPYLFWDNFGAMIFMLTGGDSCIRMSFSSLCLFILHDA